MRKDQKQLQNQVVYLWTYPHPPPTKFFKGQFLNVFLTVEALDKIFTLKEHFFINFHVFLRFVASFNWLEIL